MTGIIMNNKSAEVLVAEDDKSVRLVVQQALARQGYTVQSAVRLPDYGSLSSWQRGCADHRCRIAGRDAPTSRVFNSGPDLPVIVMSARSTLLPRSRPSKSVCLNICQTI